jgi:plastocyanin
MKIVYIQNNTLSPTTITIRKGSYVKWVNRDTIGHRILGDYSEYKFDSGMLYQNYTYTKVFSTTGTYTYHDANTSGINGTIIVTN